MSPTIVKSLTIVITSCVSPSLLVCESYNGSDFLCESLMVVASIIWVETSVMYLSLIYLFCVIQANELPHISSLSPSLSLDICYLG